MTAGDALRVADDLHNLNATKPCHDLSTYGYDPMVA